MLAGDVSTGIFRPIVPQKFRKDFFSVFTTFHTWGGSPPRIWCLLGLSGESSPRTSPPGGEPASTASRPRFTSACSRSQSPSCSNVFLISTLIWWDPYSTVTYNLIFTDNERTSKWMEAILLSDTSAAACTKALIFSWISRFGVPEMITSDRGTQFTSNIWSKPCEMLLISHRQTTAYHPESNGAVERLHRHLKDDLRARATAATWFEKLPFVLLGLRAQPREDTGFSPAKAVFGTPIILPNEFLQGDEFSADEIVNKLKKNWILLLFTCPGTSPVPSCRQSFQTSCCTPPLSGCATAASSRLSINSMMAPTPSCGGDPAPSPSGPGRGTRSSPSAASRPTWKQQSATLRLTPGKCPGGPATTKRVLFSDLLVPSPFPSQAPPSNSPGTVFLVADQFFAGPGPATPSQSPQQRYLHRQRSPPQRLDL
jgi:hypothetical protein